MRPDGQRYIPPTPPNRPPKPPPAYRARPGGERRYHEARGLLGNVLVIENATEATQSELADKIATGEVELRHAPRSRPGEPATEPRDHRTAADLDPIGNKLAALEASARR